MGKITTFLTFDDQAEEAVKLYTSIFPNSKILSTTPGPGGKPMSLTFTLDGQTYMALNGGPSFSFSQGISLFVSCETQAEIDALWATLSPGGKELRCGWLHDRFGVVWQIIPSILGSLLGDPDREKAGRAMKAMLGMVKLDIDALKRAHAG